MEKLSLSATVRTAQGKSNKLLRSHGLVPAVSYGHGSKPESLTLESKLLEKVYSQAGGNKIISLKIGEGRAKNVLIHDVQQDVITGLIRHADLYVVRMDELIRTEIPLHFIGESTAVYQDEGTLVKNLEVIEIECLPGNLPDAFEVDISVLDDFEKSITVADLAIPEGVKILVEEPSEILVAKVEPPRSDEEMAELEEAVSEDLPEGVQEEQPIVVKEENEGDMDRRDKK
jgi:large subunit ribosomal protein L25